MKKFVTTRILSVVFALCLTAGVLSACGGSAAESAAAAPAPAEGAPAGTESAPAAGGAVDVTIWTWDNGQFQSRVDGYNALHPDAPLNVEFITVASADYLTKLQQSYASGGELPDILAAEMTYRASAFELDVWENLAASPYNLDTEQVFDYALGCTKNSKGEVVAVENAQNPAAMAFKRNLALQYLGTEDPDELSAMFQTYDDYLAVGERVYSESNQSVTLFAGLRDVSTMMLNQARHQSNLGDDGSINVSAKIRGILEMIVKIRDTHAAGNLTYGSAQWNANFAADANILFPAAQWMPAYMIEPNDPEGEGNWGMFKPAGDMYGWGGTCYGISKQSEHKETMWEFLHWGYMSEDGAALAKDRGTFLPVKALYDDPTYTQGTRPYFGDQNIYTLLMEEIAPNIPVVQISVYDKLVQDSLDMIVDSLNADPALGVDEAMRLFMEDLQAKEPNVTVQ